MDYAQETDWKGYLFQAVAKRTRDRTLQHILFFLCFKKGTYFNIQDVHISENNTIWVGQTMQNGEKGMALSILSKN